MFALPNHARRPRNDRFGRNDGGSCKPPGRSCTPRSLQANYRKCQSRSQEICRRRQYTVLRTSYFSSLSPNQISIPVTNTIVTIMYLGSILPSRSPTVATNATDPKLSELLIISVSPISTGRNPPQCPNQHAKSFAGSQGCRPQTVALNATLQAAQKAVLVHNGKPRRVAASKDTDGVDCGATGAIFFQATIAKIGL